MRPLLILSLLALAYPARAANPDALAGIIDGRCVPDQQQHASPAPCEAVDIGGGVAVGTAVLKDIVGRAQYLLLATGPVSGIEDPAVLASDAPNYFAAAWDARGAMQARLPQPVPRDAISLAVNSPTGRTQNRLHIHVDCLRSDVRAVLDAAAPAIGADWAPLAVPLAGRDYRARKLAGETLTANPFRLLLASEPGGAGAMGTHTLAIVGATFADGPGFILLDHTAHLPFDRGSAEELQDHACAVAG